MREIKFKAWDKRINRVRPVESIDWVSGEVWLRDFGLMVEEFGEEKAKYLQWVDLADITLLQYTGLKDKNSKEIYEADIVKLTHTYGEGETTTHSVFFNFLWWDIDPRTTKNLGRMALEDEYILEVLGNIYENPELLK